MSRLCQVMLALAERAQVGLDHAADEQVGEGRCVGVREEGAQLTRQGRAEPIVGADVLDRELAPAWGRERLGEQLREQVHPGAVLAQYLGKAVVLIAGPLGPHHIVEEKIGRVRRGQPLEFGAWPVDDHLTQRSDLGLDAHL